MTRLYRDNAVNVGVDFDGFPETRFGSDVPAGSTDMGNVSYEVPSIHPMFYIGADTLNHIREFTTSAGDIKALWYTLAVGKALDMTTLDILAKKGELLPNIKAEFDADKKARA